MGTKALGIGAIILIVASCIFLTIKTTQEKDQLVKEFLVDDIASKPEVQIYSRPLTDEEIIIGLLENISQRVEYVELHTILDEHDVTTIDLVIKLRQIPCNHDSDNFTLLGKDGLPWKYEAWITED